MTIQKRHTVQFSGTIPVRAPHADVCETDTDFCIDFDVPGMALDELQLRFEPGALILEGVRSRRTPPDMRRCIEVEIEYGAFARRVLLPNSCDGANTTAHLEHGVLRVRVPKLNDVSHRIEIA